MELKPGMSSALVTGGASGIGDVSAAFEKHLETYGGLNICINSAGIGTVTRFDKDESDGSFTWRHTVSVNLIAVIACTRIAVCIMF